jgi:hypothetical protein
MIPKLVAALTFASAAAFSQPAQLSGDWQTSARRLGATQYMIVNLVQNDEKITGTFGGLKIECTLRNNVCEGDLRRGSRNVREQDEGRQAGPRAPATIRHRSAD